MSGGTRTCWCGALLCHCRDCGLATEHVEDYPATVHDGHREIAAHLTVLACGHTHVEPLRRTA